MLQADRVNQENPLTYASEENVSKGQDIDINYRGTNGIQFNQGMTVKDYLAQEVESDLKLIPINLTRALQKQPN